MVQHQIVRTISENDSQQRHCSPPIKPSMNGSHNQHAKLVCSKTIILVLNIAKDSLSPFVVEGSSLFIEPCCQLRMSIVIKQHSIRIVSWQLVVAMFIEQVFISQNISFGKLGTWAD